MGNSKDFVFDTENNDLLRGVHTFHCSGVIDVSTGEEYWFRSHQLREFLDFLDTANNIIAHNAQGYDVPALQKIARKRLNYEWTPKANVRCTKVMSQVLNFTRFGFGHSLARWGQFLEERNQGFLDEAIRDKNKEDIKKYTKQVGTFYKGDYTGGFEEFNEDMWTYMKQDVRLNVHVYKYLIAEFLQKAHTKVGQAINDETLMDGLMAEETENGWLFNKEGAEALVGPVEEKLKEFSDYINPLLSATATVKDPDTTIEKEPTTGKRYGQIKKPTYTKTGSLNRHLINWFSLPDSTTVDTSPFFSKSEGFCRIEFAAGDIGNTTTVKNYLSTIGWKPDEWNWKRNPDTGKLEKTSAKLSDSSLEPLGETGKVLMEYYSLRSRRSILQGWFDYIDEEGRLHGDVFNIGTPTFRQTHKIIANLPSGKATLGKEFRELFITPPGRVLVSADSAGCQLRLLAHFMEDPAFTKEVLEGDVHQKNADILTAAVRKALQENLLKQTSKLTECDLSTQRVERYLAKPFIFAFLYGAGGAKLARILGVPAKIGTKLKESFQKAYPNLDALITEVKFEADSQGFISGLDDRPIYCDTTHKALNYLIQGAEATVMKATIILIDKRLKEANIDFKLLLFYHDEATYEIPEEQAEQAKVIIMKSFEDAPKKYGIDIMECGDCKLGADYYAVH